MKTNKAPVNKVVTHEGGKGRAQTPEQELRRTVMSCMLWEDTFYEDGESVADRIAKLIPMVKPDVVASIAIEAREQMYIRHVPLLICVEMLKHPSHKPYVEDTLYRVIQRPDEMGEFLSLYWRNGKCPIAAQAKRALARAFGKFNEYSLAKYNSQNAAIKLFDVMKLVHPRPANNEQEALWRRLKEDNLALPDTWERLLSAGEDKKATFERLIAENKLGGMAYLRNLRNMREAGIAKSVIGGGLTKANMKFVLPWRFIAAARYNPSFEDIIEPVMLREAAKSHKLPGKTVLLLDVSDSMNDKISEKSDMTRMDASCGLAILAREICEEVEIYTFSNNLVQIPTRRGFALRDAITHSQYHGGTALRRAVEEVNQRTKYDRIIVFTDEQSQDGNSVPAAGTRGYVVNVSTYRIAAGIVIDRKEVRYNEWIAVNGFSQATINWILATELGIFNENEDEEDE